MNRRSLLWAMSFAGLFVAAFSAAYPLNAEETPATRILLCYTKPDHPYASHMYEFECGLLAKCLEQTPGVETAIAQDWPTDDAAFDGVTTIVYYSRPAGDIVLDPQRREKFRALMKDGVGLVCIHWATGSNEKNAPDWLNALGGWFQRPPCGIKTTTSRLTQVDPKHPVSRGWKNYDLHDEFYLDLRFHKDTKPLLTVEVDGKRQVVAWALQRKDSQDGRSFGTTLGHFHENFKIESFRRAIVNGILWTAHVDVPADGAPVKLEEADWTLPPKK